MALSDPVFEISPLDGGVTYVRLTGDVDVAVESRVQSLLDGLVRKGHKCLLVDLTDVSFIDSAGLGVLLDTAKQLRPGRFAVVCPDDAMRGMFELVGLNLLFLVDETVDQAVRHLRPGRRLAPRSRAPRPQTRS
jgi:anti-sigma B factor antagonist